LCRRVVGLRRAIHQAKDMAGLLHIPVIAIVEDDASVRNAMQNLVRSLGFIACMFASAEDFLQSPRLNDMACVIADVQMPGMSGVELQSRLLSRGCRTPIIFITAFHDDAIRARAMQAGAVCFLHKPVDGKTLVEFLDKALNRHVA
jgi:FixJ family two-component response regulator